MCVQSFIPGRSAGFGQPGGDDDDGEEEEDDVDDVGDGYGDCKNYTNDDD